ncbi:unnamed protein product [marine sediment metagenome]|uniref:Uncharacterized protein n=1 Tax=marine sediment metagenome TaxID=412755 RepID=X1VSR6_9ZZZZ
MHVFHPKIEVLQLVRSITLIKEYLKLIDEVYKDVSEIKEYLIEKGVRF